MSVPSWTSMLLQALAPVFGTGMTRPVTRMIPSQWRYLFMQTSHDRRQMISLEIPSDLGSTALTSTSSRGVGPTKCGDAKPSMYLCLFERIGLTDVCHLCHVYVGTWDKEDISRVRVVVTLSSLHLHRLELPCLSHLVLIRMRLLYTKLTRSRHLVCT